MFSTYVSLFVFWAFFGGLCLWQNKYGRSEIAVTLTDYGFVITTVVLAGFIVLQKAAGI